MNSLKKIVICLAVFFAVVLIVSCDASAIKSWGNASSNLSGNIVGYSNSNEGDKSAVMARIAELASCTSIINGLEADAFISLLNSAGLITGLETTATNKDLAKNIRSQLEANWYGTEEELKILSCTNCYMSDSIDEMLTYILSLLSSNTNEKFSIDKIKDSNLYDNILSFCTETDIVFIETSSTDGCISYKTLAVATVLFRISEKFTYWISNVWVENPYDSLVAYLLDLFAEMAPEIDALQNLGVIEPLNYAEIVQTIMND